MESVEGRIVEIESKTAFHEAALADMSKMIIEQDARIQRLEATVRALRDKLKDVSGEGQIPLPEGERPPHY